MVATAGATAGGGLAIGKIVATVFAAMVIAGTAGEVERDAARAGGSQRAPASEQARSANRVEPVFSEAEPRRELSAQSDLKFDREDAPTRETLNAAPGAPGPDAAPAIPVTQDKPVGVDAPAEVAPKVAPPVEEVVELPRKVVDNVVGGLDGSAPLDQTAGNVVGEVAGTLGEVTSGLLGPNSR
jgi:hypothetical protein